MASGIGFASDAGGRGSKPDVKTGSNSSTPKHSTLEVNVKRCSDETLNRGLICHRRCDTLKNSYSSMAVSAERRSKVTCLHRLWSYEKNWIGTMNTIYTELSLKSFWIWASSEPHDSFLPHKGQENSILLNNMDMSFSKLGDMMKWLRFCLLPYDSDIFCW